MTTFQYPVDVDHSLSRTRTHHPWEGATREGEVVLLGSGGKNIALGLHHGSLPLMDQAQLPVGEETVGQGVQHDLHTVLPHLPQQVLSDPEAPDTGLVFPGAEEFMDLLEELTSGPLVFVDHQDLSSSGGRLDRGAQPGGTAADHRDLYFILFHAVLSPMPDRAGSLPASRPGPA